MEEEVYNYLTKIPQGKVVTYKMIATNLGNPNLSRVIGNILHKNKNPDKYPCYKVVNSKGFLAEHFAYGGKEGQKCLLEQEGIVVENYKVDLKKYLYQELK